MHCISDRHKLLFDATSNPYAPKQFILLHKQLYNAYLLSKSASLRNNLNTCHLCPNLEKNGPFWQREKYSKQKITTPQHRENISALKRTFFFLITKEKNLYMSIRTRTAQECSTNPKCRRQKRHMDCQNLNMVEK